MAKGSGVNWESTETWQRVVASIIATGVKLDLREMATYFGCTYDTLENRFRKIKKEAAVLKEDVQSGQRGEVTPIRTKSTPYGTPRKTKTPKKEALRAITNGRVTKDTPKSRKHVVKEEMRDEEDMGSLSHSINDASTTNLSFDFDGDEMV